MTDDIFPPRRVIETVECEFESIRFYLTMGFYPSGRVGEIQVSGLKHGAHVERMMQDACTLISALLQRFVSPLALHDMVARNSDGSPASLIGEAIFSLVESLPNGGAAHE